eukprot:TRINITY_DN52113_c0_g1_i1.p1 TRINITY_DN52113_c0_g1~~TRINITY_DN52113_c0_g1_i1.p1  ORF type:complete len:212 (-),score=29.19 TRINITY_DN52113_c0_g1_i1:33-668(-)
MVGLDAARCGAIRGQARNLEALLEHDPRYKADINFVTGNVFGGGLLALAAYYPGNYECVRMLIDRRANPNDEFLSGNTALHNASNVEDGDVRMVKLLLVSRADVNRHAEPKSLHWQELYASMRKRLESEPEVSSNFVKLIANRGGCTPLHYAAQCGSSDIVLALLAAKANPLARNRYGKTPFDLAKDFGPFPAVEAILRNEGALQPTSAKL